MKENDHIIPCCNTQCPRYNLHIVYCCELWGARTDDIFLCKGYMDCNSTKPKGIKCNNEKCDWHSDFPVHGCKGEGFLFKSVLECKNLVIGKTIKLKTTETSETSEEIVNPILNLEVL